MQTEIHDVNSDQLAPNQTHNTPVMETSVMKGKIDVDSAVPESQTSQQAMNKIPYSERLKVNKEIIEALAKEFPECFSVEGEAKPLKVGIFQDMIEQPQIAERFSKTLLRSALRYYTMSWRYLSSIKEGAIRVDLLGNASGELDASHVEHAQAQLKAAKEKVAARKAERTKQSKQTRNTNSNVKQQTKPRKNGSAQTEAKQPNSKAPSSTKKSTIANPPRSVSSSKANVASSAQTKISSPKADLATGNGTKVEISNLFVGQKVNIMLAKTKTNAEIAEIMKDSVRVNLPSGLSLSIGLEHIYL